MPAQKRIGGMAARRPFPHMPVEGSEAWKPGAHARTRQGGGRQPQHPNAPCSSVRHDGQGLDTHKRSPLVCRSTTLSTFQPLKTCKYLEALWLLTS
eukprot:356056-Chlamydomonas_euryale.AAC.6